jgi:hypothetical protein
MNNDSKVTIKYGDACSSSKCKEPKLKRKARKSHQQQKIYCIASYKQEKETILLGTIITMVWFKPTTLYQDCPEGDSFESSPDNPLMPIDTNLTSFGRSAAPTASSNSVPQAANDTGAGTISLAPQRGVKPPRTSSSSASKSNKKGKKAKKERTPLSFFNVRKTKERPGAFPLLEQSKNEKVRIVQYIEFNVMLYRHVSERIASHRTLLLL